LNLSKMIKKAKLIIRKGLESLAAYKFCHTQSLHHHSKATDSIIIASVHSKLPINAKRRWSVVSDWLDVLLTNKDHPPAQHTVIKPSAVKHHNRKLFKSDSTLFTAVVSLNMKH